MGPGDLTAVTVLQSVPRRPAQSAVNINLMQVAEDWLQRLRAIWRSWLSEPLPVPLEVFK